VIPFAASRLLLLWIVAEWLFQSHVGYALLPPLPVVSGLQLAAPLLLPRAACGQPPRLHAACGRLLRLHAVYAPQFPAPQPAAPPLPPGALRLPQPLPAAVTRATLRHPRVAPRAPASGSARPGHPPSPAHRRAAPSRARQGAGCDTPARSALRRARSPERRYPRRR